MGAAVEHADFREASIRWGADPETSVEGKVLLSGGWIHVLERGDVVVSRPASEIVEVRWYPNAMPAVR